MDLSGTIQGAGGVGGLLAVKAGSASYYPTYDGNGNVSEYLAAGGAVAAHYEYDPFGNDVSPEPPTGVTYVDFSHRFSTKPLDPETGLYYYGYRYYDTATGRWPSRDPIEENGGLNLYGFVESSPIDKFDDLGHASRSQRDQKRRQRNLDNKNGRNRNKTCRIAQRANKGAGGGGVVVDVIDVANTTGRDRIRERARNQAEALCDKRANHSYTRGVGRVTKCPYCCQVELIVDCEDIWYFNDAKMFMGTCEETKEDRDKHAARAQIRVSGEKIVYTISYYWTGS